MAQGGRMGSSFGDERRERLALETRPRRDRPTSEGESRKMRRILAGSFGLLLVFGLAAFSVVSTGCGGGGGNATSAVLPTPTVAPTKSVITVTVSPNPIIAEPSGDS